MRGESLPPGAPWPGAQEPTPRLSAEANTANFPTVFGAGVSMTTVGDPLVGRLLDGRYQITERLARGGMATVYRGVDTRLTRTVAVKVMHVGLGDDAEFARKFDREARAAARLAHPNVVAVFDQGSDVIEGHGSRPYIVMEHVDGYTLRDVINREAPMLPLRALEVIEPVLAALAAAHDAGLVHRDVKPENVLISDRGQIKVADFGLAKAISSQTSTATQGLLIGTVSYLPPELVVSGQADARSDVYSTGVVLFELLTGRKPHTGDTPIQVAYAHVHSDVPAPSRFPTAGPIPPYLDALVARATSRNAGARPADARVLLTEVRRVQSALREGRRDDPELVRHLRAPAPAPVPPARRDGADYEVTQLVPTSLPSPPTLLEAPPPTPRPRPLPRPAPSDAERLARQREWQTRRRRRGLIALLLVLLLTTAVAAAGWYLTTGRFTTAPALASLSRVDAETVAERAGLDLEITEEYSESVPRGVVIQTDPSAGSKILKTGRMAAAVSRGPERFAMPTVVGLSRAAAEKAVQGANFSLDEVTEKYSDTVRDGVVISASKKAGVSLKRGTQVDLVISKGPAPIPIKNYTGKKFVTAVAALREAGFTVVAERKNSDDVAKGLVLAQTPDSGDGSRGDTITLTESLGPVLVRVPNVSRMGVKAAEQVMARKGFKTRVRPVAVNYLGLGYVAFTGPRTRSQAPKGSTITLYVV
jgi:serine/threonine-protein kinase